ncbi:hypothetical protein EV702DRAFT_1042185 [Suillus placidus]|uniref:Uncharacterized protein n=1 Tax=Suillus placidus TaxID=48579 RepID=A0A9P7D7B9_9AGAM|nr:hypothetical protein EV702DRAFT_1042185 [Suillus placidus]
MLTVTPVFEASKLRFSWSHPDHVKGQALSNIHGLSLETILTFVTLASAVKEDMILAQPATYDVSTPPDFMPPTYKMFYPPFKMLLLNKVEQVQVMYVAKVNVEWVPGSKITYHHNYRASDKDCIYYDYTDGLPDTIQVAVQFVRIVVVDGVTVSRLCCSVPYCFKSLRFGQWRVRESEVKERKASGLAFRGESSSEISDLMDRTGHRMDKCTGSLMVDSIVSDAESVRECRRCCTKSVTPGSKTYEDPDHKAIEVLHTLHDNPTHVIPKSTIPGGDMSDEGLQEFEVSAVLWFVLFYIVALQLLKLFHIKDDPFFNDIGLSIDIFHLNRKHSENNLFCQENCNLMVFLELMVDGDGKWYFNFKLSVCKQTNSWFGKFNSITQGMKPIKFDFYLDKVILCRNCLTLEKLKSLGC